MNDHSENPADSRKMTKSILLGQHSHRTAIDVTVNIWQRSGKYIARGRHVGKSFGKTLGSDRTAAEIELRDLLGQLDRDAFVLPCDAPKRQVSSTIKMRASLREMIDAFLKEKRQLRGKKTVRDYTGRLFPLIQFSETQDVIRRWAKPKDINREFALELKSWLFQYQTSRNGKPGAPLRPMSPRQTVNVLATCRTLIHWAIRTGGFLPASFVNPFTDEIVGTAPKKNPLSEAALSVELRIQLIGSMDIWELLIFSVPFTLPLRPEDYTGLTIADVDWSRRRLLFGSRAGNIDFNKGRQDFVVPIPLEIEMLLRHSIDGRQTGPVFLSRRHLNRTNPRVSYTTENEFVDAFKSHIRKLSPGEVQCANDWKQRFRRFLIQCGGVSSDAVAKAFKALLQRTEITSHMKLYDLRSSLSTDLEHAGVSHLVQRYVTGHTTSDIMNAYVTLDPDAEMQKHFLRIAPLLDAIRCRAIELGIEMSGCNAASSLNECLSTVANAPFVTAVPAWSSDVVRSPPA